jgi:hypothetical protein
MSPIFFFLNPRFEEFQVTREGPFASHRFKHGVPYEVVPSEEKFKFDEVEVGKAGGDDK